MKEPKINFLRRVEKMNSMLDKYRDLAVEAITLAEECAGETATSKHLKKKFDKLDAQMTKLIQ